jgi:hypothetical protein
MNRAYAEHFADADALYLTLNTRKNSAEYSLDKLIKTLFTKTEIRTAGVEQRKKRANRIERLVAIETTTANTHAHIIINPKSLDTELIKQRLRLTWMELCDTSDDDFLFHIEELRSREASSRYNHKELLTKDEREAFASSSNISTFVSRATQHRLEDELRATGRMLIRQKIPNVSDKALEAAERKSQALRKIELRKRKELTKKQSTPIKRKR